MAVVEERVVVILFHLEPTFRPLDGFLSRIATYGILYSGEAVKGGELYFLHYHTNFGVGDQVDGALLNRNNESTEEGWSIRCNGGKIEYMISLIQLHWRGDWTGIKRYTSIASSLLVEETSIHACIGGIEGKFIG